MEREKPSENKQRAITPFHFKLLMKPTVQELWGKRVFKTFFQVVKNNLCFIIMTPLTTSRHTLWWGGSENDERGKNPT